MTTVTDKKPAAARSLRADARRNREAVLEAARQAFADEGFICQMDDIARTAGVGVGTVYRHFPNKEALLDALVAARFELLAEETAKALERDDPWDVGWWRYRVPGLGQVDWVRLVDAMYEGGFDGVLSVEHEDPVWGGTEERVEAGLEVARRTLRPLLVR